MALVAGFIAFAILDPPLGVIVLVVGATLEVGESYFWWRYLKRIRVKSGVETIPGSYAEVIAECRPFGQVRYDGAIWAARCEAGAAVGETVRVDAVDGLTLVVEPAPDAGDARMRSAERSRDA